MRIIRAIKLYFQRRKILNQLADYYISVQQPKLGMVVHTEPDPELAHSVDQLVHEINQPVYNLMQDERNLKMSVINRRLGVN